MLQLHGPPALSAFRIQKLLGRLSALDDAVSGVDAGFMHFVDLEAPLTPQQRGVLDALLRYGPRRDPIAAGGESGLVVPRIGAVSPWSSKATDIAQVCGLKHVRRIERGVAYTVRAARPLGRQRLAQL